MHTSYALQTVDDIALFIAEHGDWESVGILYDAMLDAGTENPAILSESQAERMRAVLSLVPPQEDLPGLRMRIIPPGKFLMGSPPEDNQAYTDERPQHEVEIPTHFWMSDTPITEGQWKAIMGNCPSSNGDDFPVVNVSWNDCQEFCKKLSEKTGKPYRLPTEEEWEYSCRAGTTTRYWSGDTEADLAKVGWYYGNSGNRIHKVGELSANPFGLYDMHGNVWEWCQDVYESYENKLSRRAIESPFQGRVLSDAATGEASANFAGRQFASRSDQQIGAAASASALSSKGEQRDPFPVSPFASSEEVAGAPAITSDDHPIATATRTTPVATATTPDSASSEEGEQSGPFDQVPASFAAALLATNLGSSASLSATGTRRHTEAAASASASPSEGEQRGPFDQAPTSFAVDLLATNQETAALPTASGASRRAVTLSWGSASSVEGEQVSPFANRLEAVAGSASPIIADQGTVAGTGQKIHGTPVASASSREGEQASPFPDCAPSDLDLTASETADQRSASGSILRSPIEVSASASPEEGEQRGPFVSGEEVGLNSIKQDHQPDAEMAIPHIGTATEDSESPEDGELRPLRGGCYFSRRLFFFRSAYRKWYLSTLQSEFFGFRVLTYPVTSRSSTNSPRARTTFTPESVRFRSQT